MKHLIATLSLLALSACTGPQMLRVASTLEVGAGFQNYSNEDDLGLSADMESSAVWATIRPLAALEPPREVVIVKED